MPSCFLSWSLTKLLLVASFLLFYYPVNSQSSTKAPTFQFEGTIPSTDPLPLVKMSPGNTKRLVITLKGRIDMITLTFQEDPYEADAFNLFIKNNNQIESTQTARFQSDDYLTLDLDPSKSLLVLQGNQGFRISKFVREKEYDVQVRGYERGGIDDSMTAQRATDVGGRDENPERTTAYFILAGVIGGLFGIVILLKGGSVLIKKIKKRLRKSSSVFSVGSRSSNKIRDGDLEAGSATPVLCFDNHAPEIYTPEYKNSLTLDERGVGESEQYQKKEFPSSLTSIESGMGKSTVASTTSLISSSGSLQNIAAKKGNQLEAITEEASYVKPMFPLGPLKVPPLKLEELNSKRRNSYCGRKLTNSKIMPAKPPVRGQQVAKTMIDLPNHKAQKENKIEYQSNKAEKEKKVVTMKDIRNLVDRVMREKKNESVDVSEESSSKEDGGDTPNYFTCLVCYQEKRSAVAEPCGHVFGCMNCTKRVMNCSKGCCALCSKKIKGYHALKG